MGKVSLNHSRRVYLQTDDSSREAGCLHEGCQRKTNMQAKHKHTDYGVVGDCCDCSRGKSVLQVVQREKLSRTFGSEGSFFMARKCVRPPPLEFGVSWLLHLIVKLAYH